MTTELTRQEKCHKPLCTDKVVDPRPFITAFNDIGFVPVLMEALECSRDLSGYRWSNEIRKLGFVANAQPSLLKLWCNIEEMHNEKVQGLYDALKRSVSKEQLSVSRWSSTNVDDYAGLVPTSSSSKNDWNALAVLAAIVGLLD